MTNVLKRHYSALVSSDCKILHYPMTVDFERFIPENIAKLDSDMTKPYVVYVGALNNKKDGIDIAIKAFALIKDIYPKHSMYLIGDYHPDVLTQKELIQQNGLTERVKYPGPKSRDEIPAILSHAELTLLPRPDSRQAQGGFPTKLGEYLASGNPAVVTSVGEIPFYLEDNVSAFIASPGSAESFAEAMNRALSNPLHAQQVGKRGQQVAYHHFNKNIQAGIFKDFLDTYIRG